MLFDLCTSFGKNQVVSIQSNPCEKMKKAIIIGISGQDGAYLSKLLINKNYAVIGTSRDAQMSNFEKLETLGLMDSITLESLALNDFRSVVQIIKKHEPDEIYNLGGQSSVALSFEQPVETFESITLGTLNLLESIRFLNMNVRLYNASSSECFGNTNGKRADEGTPFNPRSPYAVAKSAAFWQIANYREAYQIMACSGILFNHESPLRPKRFVTRKVISQACQIAVGQRQKLELGNISVERDWGWAPEYVEAMWQMLQQQEMKDYVIATGQTNSLQEFVRETFRQLDLDYEQHLIYNQDLCRPTDIMTSLANPRLAAEELGWRAKVHMSELIGLMIAEEFKRIKKKF
jgi:GDPmannose 4,6-dehydratase